MTVLVFLLARITKILSTVNYLMHVGVGFYFKIRLATILFSV